MGVASTCCGFGAVGAADPNPVPDSPACSTLPVPPGLPVPPTTPLENPAEATVPCTSRPPGTPLATPEPKSTPFTELWRAAPDPGAPTPGVPEKDPTDATFAGRVAFGLGVTPTGSPNPPVFGVGGAVLFATRVG